MSQVFISYRRSDSRWFARALKNKLDDDIGEDQVFMDVDSIDPGLDFVDVIDEVVAKVDVLIAIIGPDFMTATDHSGKPRIQCDNDFVRLEIATALKRKIRVIPLLLQDTHLPTSSELPDDLKELVRRNAIQVNELTFEADIDRVVDSLHRLWEKEGKEVREPDTKPPISSPAPNLISKPTEKPRPRTANPRSKAGGPGWLVPITLVVVAAIAIVLFVEGPWTGLTARTNPSEDSNIAGGSDSTPKPETDPPKPALPDPLITPFPESPLPELPVPDPPEPLPEPPLPEPPSPEPPLPEPPLPEPEVQSVKGMAWIKPGKFSMGSPYSEQGRGPDETPHQVVLTSGFYMGTHEISQRQFQEIMGNNPSVYKSANAPVENVDWSDAKEFCDRLNEMDEIPASLGLGKLSDGYRYTLPTEAQWEFACRAGKATRLSERELNKVAVCYVRNTEGFNNPSNVGSRKVNEWGLYDMLGNVEEWCLDVYGPYAAGEVKDPTGPVGSPKSAHVFRGGSYWHSNVGSKHACRPAVRNSGIGRSQTCGFRIAAVKD